MHQVAAGQPADHRIVYCRSVATVWLSAAESVALPEVCVVTGAAATRRLRVTAQQRPVGASWLLVAGRIWLYLLARAFGGEQASFDLPVSAAAYRRHRMAERTCTAVAAAGLVAIAVGALGARWLAAIGLVALLSGLLGGALVDGALWVGLHFEPGAGAIIVTRCHPAFVDAVRRSRRTPAR